MYGVSKISSEQNIMLTTFPGAQYSAQSLAEHLDVFAKAGIVVDMICQSAPRGSAVDFSFTTSYDTFIDPKLEAKVVAQAEGNKKSVIKTWSRASMISPDFVGQTIAVHNGNKFIPVYVTENMVGHKLGEFAPTRNFRGHAGNKKK